MGLILPAGEEKQLVFDDRSADLAAETIVIEGRIEGLHPLAYLRQGGLRINRIHIAVLEIFVEPAVPLVGAALDGLVELATGRVAELGRELILQDRKVVDRIVRKSKQGACNGLGIVVDALNREVVIARPLASDRRSHPFANAAATRNPGIQQREVQYAAAG